MIINAEIEARKFVRIVRLICENILFLTVEDARTLVKHNQWQRTLGGGKCMYSLRQENDVYYLKRIFMHPQLKMPISLEAKITPSDIELIRKEEGDKDE